MAPFLWFKTVFSRARPGEEFAIGRKWEAVVAELSLRGTRDTLVVASPERDQQFSMGDLPVAFGRYRISRGATGLIVTIEPPADEEFVGVASAGDWGGCTPIVEDDFRGLALAAPTRVSYADALGGEQWHARRVPQFFVAGLEQWGAEELSEVWDEELFLVIERSHDGLSVRRTVDYLAAQYEYEVLGINRSPAAAPEPLGPPELDEGFVSTGSPFNVRLGPFADPPESGSYTLTVRAERGRFRSETRTIIVDP